MKLLIILWTLNLGSLDSHQFVFKGTLAECQVRANEIRLKSNEKVIAGCYQTMKTPPYIKRNNH